MNNKRTLRIGTLKTGGTLYLEVEIRPTTQGPELSICGTYPGGAGQCREALGDLETYAPGWSADLAAKVREVWNRWHLNGMHAGCAHQRATWDLRKSITFRTYSIDWNLSRDLERQAERGESHAKALLYDLDKAGIKPFTFGPVKELPKGFTPVAEHEHGKYLNMYRESYRRPPILVREQTEPASAVRATDHPDGLLCKPCEVCGYQYGTKWLYEPLPDEVIAFVEGLPSGLPTREDGTSIEYHSPYEIEAAGWLRRYGVTLKTEHAKAKPGLDGHANASQHWRVTLTHRASGRTLSFDFWNSQHDTEKGTPLSAYSVLACLSSDKGYIDADEIVRELGSMPPSQARKAAQFGKRINRWLKQGPGERASQALDEIR